MTKREQENSDYLARIRGIVLECKADAERSDRDVGEAAEAYESARQRSGRLVSVLQDFADCGDAQPKNVRAALEDLKDSLARVERLSQIAQASLKAVERRFEADSMSFSLYNSKEFFEDQ